MSEERAFFEGLGVKLGLILVVLAAMTSLMQYAAASREGGDWTRLDDLDAWIWTALAAFFVGFWGYGAILLSALSPRKLGRTMFMVLGFLYLGFALLLAFDIFGSGINFRRFIEVLVVPVVSAVVMLPLFALVAFIGRKAG